MICEDGGMDTTFASNLLAEMERALREERPDLDVAGIMEVARFAAEAHGATGVVRRYTGVPYIEHPVEVAMIVARAGLGAVAVRQGFCTTCWKKHPRRWTSCDHASETKWPWWWTS